MPALQKEMQASSTSNFRYFTCLLDKGHIRTAAGGFLCADIFFSCAGCCACWPGKMKTPPLRCGTALQQAMRRGGGVIRYNKSSLKRLVHRTCSRNYSCGPAETRALPCSLPSYLAKFLMKRLARSSAFLFHSAASA